jgi:hypothetical protein
MSDAAVTALDESTRARDFPIAVDQAMAKMIGINRAGQEGLKAEPPS